MASDSPLLSKEGELCSPAAEGPIEAWGGGKSALWEEDSPYFRQNALNGISQMKQLSSSMKELIKGMKALCKATVDMGAASRSMARANLSAASNLSSTLETDKDLQPLLWQFGSTLEEIAHAQETLAHTLTQSFILPLETFCSKEMDKVPELERAFQQERNDFTEALGKFLHGSSVKASKGASVASVLGPRALEVAHCRRSYEQTRHRLGSKVDELETRRTLELTESIAACLFALHSFHHQSMDLVSTLNPCMEELRLSQTRARARLKKAQAEWEKRREMLDMILPLDVPERMLEAAEEARLSRGASEGGTLHVTGVYESVEKKYGVLDVQASLRSFFRPRHAPDVHFESFLFWKTSGKYTGTVWVRRWFVLEGSKLYYVREQGDREGEQQSSSPQPEGGGEERSLVCDVVLSTVREVVSSAEHPFCFEIFSANRKSYLLQAEGPHDYQAWIRAIRKRIERLLIGDDKKEATGSGSSPRHADAASHHDRSSSRSPGEPGGRAAAAAAEGAPRSRGPSPVPSPTRSSLDCEDPVSAEVLHRDPVLKELAESNPVCVDCGTAKPDWLSLNLGVLICIGCSGIHRSLGVHISKVRSMVLDSLDPLDVAVLRRLGNERANRVWEHKLLDGWTKPAPADTRAVKENYIRAKYTWRGFIEIDEPGVVPAGVTPVDFYSKRLVEAVENDDMEGALQALVKGADLKWRDEEGRTAMHAAASHGRGAMVAFLFQNGAEGSVRDARNLLPVDLARAHDHQEVVRYLLK